MYRSIQKTILVASTILIMGAGIAHAEDHEMMMDHAKMNHEEMMSGGLYDEAMKTMHEDMMKVKPTGDADIDFVEGMIPHHQGAIDMAKVVLEKGSDPEIRKLAEGIVKAQESEIKMMQDWLAVHKK